MAGLLNEMICDDVWTYKAAISEASSDFIGSSQTRELKLKLDLAGEKKKQVNRTIYVYVMTVGPMNSKNA